MSDSYITSIAIIFSEIFILKIPKKKKRKYPRFNTISKIYIEENNSYITSIAIILSAISTLKIPKKKKKYSYFNTISRQNLCRIILISRVLQCLL